LARRPEIVGALDQAVAETNSVLSRAEHVRDFRILPGPWTAESGELTPKLSLRRRVIDDRHAAIINSMYA
ncbi:long-chain fatty acid--CoA ligase, partial [Streptomyces albidoflavus]